MKRFLAVVMAVAFVLPVVGFAVAAEKAAAPAVTPAATKAAPAAEKAPAMAPAAEKKAGMPKAQLFTGSVEAVDAAGGTFTVKGKKGNVEMKVGEKVKLGDVKVGDKVVVKYADGTASSVKVVKAPRAKKGEPKADMKPAAEKKAAPMAAPAPAPAAVPAKPMEKK
jgi:hypothetical protein